MISKSSLTLFLFALLAPLCRVEAAPIDVVVTIPDLKWAAERIGGNEVRVRSLLKGTENPHYVDAVPRFIQWASNADVLCFIGLDLEVGWLPEVLSRSGNARVQPGGKGFCEVGKSVEVLDRQGGAVDRSMGDIHPFGNPHFWLSPKRLAQGAKRIREILADARPEKADLFLKNQGELERELESLLSVNRARLEAALAGSKGPHAVEYHKEFVYFAADHGLSILTPIEEKPGVPPSAGRLARVALEGKKTGVRFALAATYDPGNLLNRFQEMSGVPVLIVPVSVQTQGAPHTYPDFQNLLVDRIIGAWKSGIRN